LNGNDGMLYLQAALNNLRDLEMAGGFIFIFGYVIGTLLFLPVTILSVSGGVLFGFGWGIVAVTAGANLSAMLAFFLGRYFLRKKVRALSRKSKKLKALNHAIKHGGWKVVALSRLSPVMPFSVLNCFMGTTRLSFPVYAIATAIAMLPGSALLVYLGATAGSLADYLQNEKQMNTLKVIVSIFGLLMSLALIAYTAYLAKRALKQEEAAL